MLVETPPESMEAIDVEALKSHVLGLDQAVRYNLCDFFIPDLLPKVITQICTEAYKMLIIR